MGRRWLGRLGHEQRTVDRLEERHHIVEVVEDILAVVARSVVSVVGILVVGHIPVAVLDVDVVVPLVGGDNGLDLSEAPKRVVDDNPKST